MVGPDHDLGQSPTTYASLALMDYSRDASSSPTSSRKQRSGSIAHHTSEPSVPSLGVANSSHSTPPQLTALTRSSTDSAAANYPPNVTLIRRESAGPEEVVPTHFDEGALRALCDMDNGVQCMMDRIKQALSSSREVAIFLKKRAVVEEEFGRNMHKIATGSQMAYVANECKPGTFASAFERSMRIHEIIAENRLRFAANLNEMCEELTNLGKEIEKSRKQTKDLHGRFERQLQESEGAREKAKQRFDMTSEELERVLVAKEGESMKESQMSPRGGGGAGVLSSGKKGTGIGLGKAVAKGGMLLKGKNPATIIRQEEDVRARLSAASDAYRRAASDYKTAKQDYFVNQLPRTLRSLKELSDEVDTATQFHLTRYAYLYESAVLNDGVTLVPSNIEDGPGLKPCIEGIDNRGDFHKYIQNYRVAHAGSAVRGPKRDDPADDPYLSSYNYNDKTINSNYAKAPVDKGTPTFGVDLNEQMVRDGVDVPKIMSKCCEAVEKYGLDTQGIYRLSGTMTKVARLKDLMDKDIDSVDLESPEWLADINNVTSVLKLWLRELPEPLLTNQLKGEFIAAAQTEAERLRHIKLHEKINDLPDANYATLKYLLGHLHQVVQQEAVNSMSVTNLAIVFGPTLFGSPLSMPVPGLQNGNPPTGPSMQQEASLQVKAIETILQHYTDIFIEEGVE